MSFPGYACLNDYLQNAHNELAYSFAINGCVTGVLDIVRGDVDKEKVNIKINSGIKILKIIEEGREALRKFDARKLADINSYELFKECLKDDDFDETGKLIVRGKLERVLELVSESKEINKGEQEEICEFLLRMSDKLASEAYKDMFLEP